MGPESLVLFSQVPVTTYSPEPVESSPHTYILFVWDLLQHEAYLSIFASVSKRSFLSGLRRKFYKYFSGLHMCYLPHPSNPNLFDHPDNI
jgi:hypothetical protein